LIRSANPIGLKPKDGAFYAPKIDIQIEDALGREWQTATIQVDLVMLPERFDLTYVDENGGARSTRGHPSGDLRPRSSASSAC